MTIGIEGHTLIAAICRSCAEIRRLEITTPVVTPLVTVGVSRNKKSGVKRMITDQQLVQVTTIHGSKAFPQSIGTSSLPIVTISSLDGRASFPFEVSLISSLVINENNLSELNQKKKKNNCCYLSDPIKWDQMVCWCLRNDNCQVVYTSGPELWKTLIIQTTEVFLTKNLECIIAYKLKRNTAKT